MENNISAFNIEKCILELLANSLFFNSNSIGIRYHSLKQRIQVIDNGIGISRNILQTIGENSFIRNSTFPKSFIFEKVRRKADSLLITTRTTHSPITYVKVFKKNCALKIIEGIQRPSRGTTISIRGLNLPFTETTKYFIYNAVAIFALFYPQVSFSVRDDEVKDVMLRISKPHYSDNILEYVCDQKLSKRSTWYLEMTVNPNVTMKAYIGLMRNSSKYARYVFVNAKLASCVEIENLLRAVLQKVHNLWLTNRPERNAFYFLFIECPQTEYDFSMTTRRLNVKFKNRKLIKSLKLCLKKHVIGPFLKNIKNVKEECNIVRKEDQIIKKKCEKNESEITKGRRDQPRLATRKKKFTPILKKKAILHYFMRRTFIFNRKSFMKTPVKAQQNWLCEEKGHESIGIIEKQSISNIKTKKLEDKSGDFIKTNQISQWSDWNFEIPQNAQKVAVNNVTYFHPQQEVDNLNDNQYYSFLPVNLKNLLKYKNKRMVQQCLEFNLDEFNKDSRIICFSNKRYRELGIRNTEKTKTVDEFKLNIKSLYNIEVLRQVNCEFIAALTIQDNRKLLLSIDQHAIDERIRYEQLLEVYKVDGKKDEYVSELLKTPLTITGLDPYICYLLFKNQQLLRKYGVTFKIDGTNIKMFSVPLCFQSRKYWNDDLRLTNFTRKLLIEIAGSLANTNDVMILPTSIHLAIATEACRGAIKFGHPLNVKQCDSLLKALRYTNGFSRCAHGRPSIVPLLDITNLKAEPKSRIKKLNYTALTKKAERD